MSLLNLAQMGVPRGSCSKSAELAMDLLMKRENLVEEANSISSTCDLWHILKPKVEDLRTKVLQETERLSNSQCRLQVASQSCKALETREMKLASEEKEETRRLRETERALEALDKQAKEASRHVVESTTVVEGLRAKENQIREQKVMSSKELEGLNSSIRSMETAIGALESNAEEARQAARIIEEQIGNDFDDDSVLHSDRDDHDGGNISSMESCTDLLSEKVLLERTRMELKAEEKVFAEKQQKLDVTGLSVYLDASSRAQEAEGELKQLKATADQASQKIESLTAERSRIFIPALKEIDRDLRECFRSLVPNGGCCLGELHPIPCIMRSLGITLLP